MNSSRPELEIIETKYTLDSPGIERTLARAAANVGWLAVCTSKHDEDTVRTRWEVRKPNAAIMVLDHSEVSPKGIKLPTLSIIETLRRINPELVIGVGVAQDIEDARNTAWQASVADFKALSLFAPTYGYSDVDHEVSEFLAQAYDVRELR